MSYLKTLNSFLPIFNISLFKYKGFINLLGRKFDFCQNYLLSGTVTIRAYYAKKASRNLRLVLSEKVTFYKGLLKVLHRHAASHFDLFLSIMQDGK